MEDVGDVDPGERGIAGLEGLEALDCGYGYSADGAEGGRGEGQVVVFVGGGGVVAVAAVSHQADHCAGGVQARGVQGPWPRGSALLAAFATSGAQCRE